MQLAVSRRVAEDGYVAYKYFEHSAIRSDEKREVVDWTSPEFTIRVEESLYFEVDEEIIL